MIDEIQQIKDSNEGSVQPDRTIRKLTDEIERLHGVCRDQSTRSQERVDGWVATADKEREAKEAALLQARELQKKLDAEKLVHAKSVCTAIERMGDLNIANRQKDEQAQDIEFYRALVLRIYCTHKPEVQDTNCNRCQMTWRDNLRAQGNLYAGKTVVQKRFCDHNWHNDPGARCAECCRPFMTAQQWDAR